MIVEYEHFGTIVKAQEHLVGRHREHCLCYHDCTMFKPGTRENCKKAQELYEFCVRNNMVTPVFECTDFNIKHQ